ncbi:MAG: hypothetical protein SD837_16245 [Candidatus Electrothrix scaldis]|nr:MAG: hypothetical protein SD837_16245 [Candidatus Electrothrix sp. GW3-3]
MRLGIFLQYFGVLVAVMGIIIAGKMNCAVRLRALLIAAPRFASCTLTLAFKTPETGASFRPTPLYRLSRWRLSFETNDIRSSNLSMSPAEVR